MDLTHQVVGKYTIKQLHKSGGTAMVYKAFDPSLDRDVAIKIIQSGVFAPELKKDILDRFFAEAKALAKLDHPNIIDVLEYGAFNDDPYIAMPFLDGPSLTELIAETKFSWDDALKILLPICDALASAHSQGIIHRDIKPSNILFTQTGQPMLVDFGIAKLRDPDKNSPHTKTGLGLGTPEYTAPEQWIGKPEFASDQYSIGVVLYQMITGQIVLGADTPGEIYLNRTTKKPSIPGKLVKDLPLEVEDLILTLLDKDPARRFKDFNEVTKKIEKLLSDHEKGKITSNNLPKVFTSSLLLRAAYRTYRRNQLTIVLIVLTLLAFCCLLVLRQNKPPLLAFLNTPTPIPPTATATATNTPLPTATSTPTPIPTPVTLFEDDFSSGNLDKWFIQNGNWHIEDGSLVGSYNCDNCDGQYKIYAQHPEFSNFDFYYDIKRLSGYDTGSSLFLDSGEDFFQFDVHPAIYQGSMVVLSKSPTYGVSVNRDLNIQMYEWYTVRIHVENNTVDIYMVYMGEEQKVMHWDDYERPFENGDIGFMLWSGANADASVAIDNVKVVALP